MKWLLSNYSSSSPVSSFFNHQQATKDGWLLTGPSYIMPPFSVHRPTRWLWLSRLQSGMQKRNNYQVSIFRTWPSGIDLSGTPLELLYLQSFTILNYSSGLPSNAERGTAMLVAAAGNSICFCIIGRIIKRVTAIIVRIPTLKSLTHQQP
ncbi:hypothetical protein SCA6_005456 [Theobroma cacao]